MYKYIIKTKANKEHDQPPNSLKTPNSLHLKAMSLMMHKVTDTAREPKNQSLKKEDIESSPVMKKGYILRISDRQATSEIVSVARSCCVSSGISMAKQLLDRATNDN